MIKQNDLTTLLELQRRESTINEQLSPIKKEIKVIKAMLLNSHTNDKRQQRGQYRLSISNGRVCPAWKSEYINVTSEASAQQVIKDTTPSVKVEVIINTKWKG